MCTNTKDLKIAEAMEAALTELTCSGFRDLVVQLRDGELTLPELWQAKLEGTEALKQLLLRQNDPLLEETVDQRVDGVSDERIKLGYRQLKKFAPLAEARVASELNRKALKVLRLSWLLEPLHLTSLYETAQDSGLKPNSVRRSLHRAVADLLTRRFSRGRMLGVLADAKTPGENDERVVMLSPTEVARMLGLADLEFQRVLGLAVTTGIDLGPMLRGQVSDFDESVGTLAVRDSKTYARPRLLVLRGEPVLGNAEYWLRLLVAGQPSEAPLVGMSRDTIQSRWNALRKRIGREDARWKDLRGVFATYRLLAGVSPKDLQQNLGHADMTMTMRYVRRMPGGNKDELRAAALHIGQLSGDWGHLRLVDDTPLAAPAAESSIEERFWAKVDRNGECWLWTASTDKHGAGAFHAAGRVMIAHRFAWSLVKAIPIERVPETRRICKTPHCLRPDHREIYARKQAGSE